MRESDMDLEPFARRLREKRLQAIDTSIRARQQIILPPVAPNDRTIEMPRERTAQFPANSLGNRFQ
jgi:hypothetical protein